MLALLRAQLQMLDQLVDELGVWVVTAEEVVPQDAAQVNVLLAYAVGSLVRCQTILDGEQPEAGRGDDA